MKKFIFSILLLSLSFSAFSMRCGTHLITEGTQYYKVIKYCGKPTARSIDYLYYEFSGGFTYKLMIMHDVVRSIEVSR